MFGIKQKAWVIGEWKGSFVGTEIIYRFVDDDTLKIKMPNLAQEQTATYAVDLSKTPHHLDVKHMMAPVERCIIKFDGADVMWMAAPPGGPGSARPTDFQTASIKFLRAGTESQASKVVAAAADQVKPLVLAFLKENQDIQRTHAASVKDAVSKAKAMGNMNPGKFQELMLPAVMTLQTKMQHMQDKYSGVQQQIAALMTGRADTVPEFDSEVKTAASAFMQEAQQMQVQMNAIMQEVAGMPGMEGMMMQPPPGGAAPAAAPPRAPVAPRVFLDNTRVEAHSLKKAAQYNGLRGTVRSFDGQKQRYAVELDKPTSKTLSLKAANLRALTDAETQAEKEAEAADVKVTVLDRALADVLSSSSLAAADAAEITIDLTGEDSTSELAAAAAVANIATKVASESPSLVPTAVANMDAALDGLDLDGLLGGEGDELDSLLMNSSDTARADSAISDVKGKMAQEKILKARAAGGKA